LPTKEQVDEVAPPAEATVWEALGERLDPANYVPHLRLGLTWAHLRSRHGEHYTMLGRDGSYLRLTEDEDRLASAMDGTRSVAALEAAQVEESGKMDLDGVTELVADLREAGCLLDPPRDIFDDLRRRLHPPKRRRRALTEGGPLMMRVPLRGIDRFVTWMHDRIGWIFFTRPVLVATVVITVVGIAAATSEILAGRDPFAPIAGSGIAGLLALVVAYYVVTFVHESAHAVTCKHFGGRVPEGGFLLFYFMPAFYVDVTDAWLQPWRRRIAVSWAGPYSGFMLAGVCAILVFILPPGWLLGTVLFKLAIVSYIDDAFNLMPLLKLDGYYILMDWLEIPELRERAMGFIKGPMWRQLLDRQRFTRREVLYAVFGILAAVYSSLSIYFAVLFWLRRLRPIVRPLWQSPGFVGRAFAVVVVAVIFVPITITLARRLWRYQQRLRQAPAAARQTLEGILSRDRLRLLEDLAFLESLPAPAIERLARSGRLKHYRRGDQVVRQGDLGSQFFVIAGGQAAVLVDDREVSRLGRGDFFGERALLGGGRRAATVLAEEDLTVLIFEERAFWQELAGTVGWQTRVRAALEEREQLAEVGLFQDLDGRELDLLAVKLTVSPFDRGDALVREGEPGDAFYIVREGTVEVRREGVQRRLRLLHPGDYFGELALLHGTPRNATVQGVEPGSVWRLGGRDFRDLVGGYLRLDEEIAATAASRQVGGHRMRRRS
jgi:putative peptide zinc metalloprotease protein